MRDFIQRFKNARKAIIQIRNGEWVVQINKIDGKIYIAQKENMSLWIANGAWFCEIKDCRNSDYFGLFWRHYVWWAAARKLKKQQMTAPVL